QYDAMVLSLTRRFANHFQTQANYALARNLDDDSNERTFRRETALNPFDLAAEWSYSKSDVRHNVSVNTLIDLPGALTAGTILFARTGTPFTPSIGFDTQNHPHDDTHHAP